MAILLNPRVWLALVLAGFLAFTHVSAHRAGRATVRADFDAYKLAQAEQRILSDRAQRNEETRRQGAIDQEAKNAADRITALETDLAGARSARDGLLRASADAARRACQGAAPAAPGKAQPSGDSLDLLVGVLARHSGELVAVGEYADRLRIAGIACERSYDALTIEP